MLRRHKVGFVLGLGFVGTLVFAYMASCPLPKGSPPVVISVESGFTTRQVAALLAKKDIIRNELFFRGLVRVMGAQAKIQSGEFQFEPGIFAWDTIKSLVEGRVIYYTLTVREGLAVEQIASLVEERGFGVASKILEIAKDASLLPD